MEKVFIKELKRTHYCGKLSLSDIGSQVVLMGWSVRYRDHGSLIFVDLRDYTGIVQIVFSEEISKDNYIEARSIRSEYCLGIKGTVYRRPEGQDNKKLSTSELEVFVEQLEIFNYSAPLPFILEDTVETVDESIRLRYRYLDLRRPKMYTNILLRHKCLQLIRNFFNKLDFLEIETPLLTRSTPEGARDFLVPSRLNKGLFYALPQSPQLFKQLLMIGGINKYYQIARCFRDEDLRSDRQPEFTQVDLEMSFIDEEDIMILIDSLLKVVVEIFGQTINTVIPRLTYNEVIDRFGLDAPDLRFGLELVDITDLLIKNDFFFLKDIKSEDFIVKAINGKNMGSLSRKELDTFIIFMKSYGVKWGTWVKIKKDEGLKWQSPVAKFFTKDQQRLINQRLNGVEGDVFFIGASSFKIVSESLGRLRLKLARRFRLTEGGRLNFCWIVNFPLLSYNFETKSYIAVHHPFTSPLQRDFALLESDPLKVRSRAYDLVLNGNEIGGGSIRIHNKDMQLKLFKILNITQDEANKKFGFLLKALSYGAPPHGGFAFGFDRLIAILAGESSIREVMVFPKTNKGTCLLTDAPGEVDIGQLLEVNLKNI